MKICSPATFVGYFFGHLKPVIFSHKWSSAKIGLVQFALNSLNQCSCVLSESSISLSTRCHLLSSQLAQMGERRRCGASFDRRACTNFYSSARLSSPGTPEFPLQPSCSRGWQILCHCSVWWKKKMSLLRFILIQYCFTWLVLVSEATAVQFAWYLINFRQILLSLIL